jgi:hypothetical protein
LRSSAMNPFVRDKEWKKHIFSITFVLMSSLGIEIFRFRPQMWDIGPSNIPSF